MRRQKQGGRGGKRHRDHLQNCGRGARVCCCTQSPPVIGVPCGLGWARAACSVCVRCGEGQPVAPVRTRGRAGRARHLSSERAGTGPYVCGHGGGGRMRTLCQLTVGRHHMRAAFGAPRHSRPALLSAQRLRPRYPVCMDMHARPPARMPGCRHSKLTLGAHFSGAPQRQGSCTRGM